MPLSLTRRATAEGIGTGLLVAVVVGSGIAAERLTDDTAVTLLANTIATAGGLVALLLMFGAVSGAHLNPAVTLAERVGGHLPTGDALAYISAQIAGGAAGAVVANLMFDLAPVTISTNERSSGGLWLGEVVATFGLLTVILALARTPKASTLPYAVAGYIAAGYWFTSSTSFANPAVTIARTLSDTFTGIAPASVPAFVTAQVAGATLAVALAHFLRDPCPAALVPLDEPDSTHPKESTMADLNDLPIDQRSALRSAATNLQRQFDGIFGVETIERFLASSYDQFAANARVVTFLPLMAERFARQRLKALARVEGKANDGLPTVLFLCVHNAGRSQMALGWFNRLAGDRAVAWSGGSEPGKEVNQTAVLAMAEIGIDIAREFPKPWTDEIVQAADVVVTMGCGDACPLFPGTRYEDWELPDPAGQDLDAVRPIRDEIERRVRALLVDLNVQPSV